MFIIFFQIWKVFRLGWFKGIVFVFVVCEFSVVGFFRFGLEFFVYKCGCCQRQGQLYRQFMRFRKRRGYFSDGGGVWRVARLQGVFRKDFGFQIFVLELGLGFSVFLDLFCLVIYRMIREKGRECFLQFLGQAVIQVVILFIRLLQLRVVVGFMVLVLFLFMVGVCGYLVQGLGCEWSVFRVQWLWQFSIYRQEVGGEEYLGRIFWFRVCFFRGGIG